jgi:hypothetical protein
MKKIITSQKLILVIMMCLPVLLFICCSGVEPMDDQQMKIDTSANNIIVMELFTSQGCSSCPPADRLLGTYASRKDIAVLSFHVDYWNKLGWTDPFSDHHYSERQENYSRKFGEGSIYTPQLVINGEEEMVGSDADKIAKSILKYKTNAAGRAMIREIKSDSEKILVTYFLAGKISNAVLNIALVQNKISTQVKAGENEGAVLTNYNVVRRFISIHPKSPENTISLPAINGVNKNECSIILYLQDNNDRIIAAAKRSIL